MIVQMLSILIADDASSERQPVLEALGKRGFSCQAASSLDEAGQRLEKTNLDAIIIYQRVAGEQLDNFVESARSKHPRLAIIVVQTEYDGLQECRIFDLGADDVVTLECSPAILAARASLRTRNRREMQFP